MTDLPSMINYILNYTGSQQISYIGHSEVSFLMSLFLTLECQGTTQAFSGFLQTEVANKVNVFIALAPAVFTPNIESLILQALAALPTTEIFEILG